MSGNSEFATWTKQCVFFTCLMEKCHLREKTATELHEFRWCHPKNACPGWSHLSWGPRVWNVAPWIRMTRIRASNSGGSLVLDFPGFRRLDQANSPVRWVSTRSHRSWKERPTIPTPLALVLLKNGIAREGTSSYCSCKFGEQCVASQFEDSSQ